MNSSIKTGKLSYPLRDFCHTLAIVAVILAAWGLIVADANRRYGTFRLVQEDYGSIIPPKIDASSPTGYEHGLRTIVLPVQGLDGYQWIVHSQQMLHDGSLRIRKTSLDNFPEGREVHWAQFFMWWLLILGRMHSWVTGMPWAASIEAVAPVANVIIHCIVVAILPWIVRRRLGTLATIGLILGLVCTYPLFEVLTYGCPDHHGVVMLATCFMSLFLAIGGGGWVSFKNNPSRSKTRSQRTESIASATTESTARRWFFLSAIAGAWALWISAAAAIPAIAVMMLGGLCSFGIWGRKEVVDFRYQSELWAYWGRVGCIASIAFYLIEYFPFHFGWRLEVNHPFYALAWLGSSQLMSIVIGSRFKIVTADQAQRKPLFFSVLFASLAMCPLALCLFVFRAQTFWVADPFLWALHRDYVFEFSTLWRWLEDVDSPSALFRAFAFAWVLIPACLMLIRTGVSTINKSLITLVALPAILLFLLGMYQIRWICNAAALWIAVIPFCITDRRLTWRKPSRALIFASLELLPMAVALSAHPLVMLIEFRDFSRGLQYINPTDIEALTARRLAHHLRRHAPDRDLVFAADLSSTNFLAFYSSGHGIGTLYWENLPGLEEAARLCSETDENGLKERFSKHRVTHLLQLQNRSYVNDLAKIYRNARATASLQDSYLNKMLIDGKLPVWTSPIKSNHLGGKYAIESFLLEFVPDQAMPDALLKLAVYQESLGNVDYSNAILREALSLDPKESSLVRAIGKVLLRLNGDDDAWNVFSRGLQGLSVEQVVNECFELSQETYNTGAHSTSLRLIRHLLALAPDQDNARVLLASLLATSPDPLVRKPEESLAILEGLREKIEEVAYLEISAAAKAAQGKFAEAVENTEAQIAIHLRAGLSSDSPSVVRAQDRLRLYKLEIPYRFSGLK